MKTTWRRFRPLARSAQGGFRQRGMLQLCWLIPICESRQGEGSIWGLATGGGTGAEGRGLMAFDRWPPRTSPAATLLYLARGARPDDVVGALAAAVQGGWIDPAEMLMELDGFGRHRHRQLLREALILAAGGSESVVEVRYARDVERRHRLPRGVRQLVRRSARHDVGYRDQHVLVELDGRLAHGGPAFLADRRRDNAAVLEGYVVLRFAGLDVLRHPCTVAADVAEALIRRGWSDLPRVCGPVCSVGGRVSQSAAIGW